MIQSPISAFGSKALTKIPILPNSHFIENECEAFLAPNSHFNEFPFYREHPVILKDFR